MDEQLKQCKTELKAARAAVRACAGHAHSVVEAALRRGDRALAREAAKIEALTIQMNSLGLQVNLSYQIEEVLRSTQEDLDRKERTGGHVVDDEELHAGMICGRASDGSLVAVCEITRGGL